MKDRRTHSSIDKLPKALQKALEQMLVDNIWPEDFVGKATGKPRYKDLEAYCKQKGHPIAKSSIGRFGKRMRILARMKESGLIVRSVMEGLSEENTSQTQKAVAELLTARGIEIASSSKMNSKQLKEVSQAIRDCASISIKADQYRQVQLKQKADSAAKNIEAIGDKKLSAETLKKIREQIYGIFK